MNAESWARKVCNRRRPRGRRRQTPLDNFVVHMRQNLAILFLVAAIGLSLHSSLVDARRHLRLDDCPEECLCPDSTTVECIDANLAVIPTTWPSGLRRLTLRNCTIHTLKKAAFRRLSSLEELKVEKCANLDVIDKHAFKGLANLRSLLIIGNPKLRELHRYSFSAIGNESPLRIVLKNNAIERLHALAFKNAHNLRELSLEDRCVTIERDGLAAISRLDFLTLKGVCVLGARAFANSSRIHVLKIADSAFALKSGAFVGLTHVNEIQLRENRISAIEAGAFDELFTVGSFQLQANRIGRIAPHAFGGMENVGALMVNYNVIAEALASPDCLQHSAHKLIFAENTLHCVCELAWIRSHQDSTILTDNYCDAGEAFKALAYFKPLGCPPLPTNVDEKQPAPRATSSPSPPSPPRALNAHVTSASSYSVEIASSSPNLFAAFFHLISASAAATLLSIQRA